jgi:hypothetical protein
MRAVKGSLGHSPKEKYREWKGLVRANGTSRRASGWAGEKGARSQGASLLALQGCREDQNIRWVPANDGMETEAAVLTHHDVTDTLLLLRLTDFSTVP